MNLILFNRNAYTLKFFTFIACVLSTYFLQAQSCTTPNIGTTSVGEPFNITIGQGKNDVYLGTTVPTYRDILGVNFAIYQLENNKLSTYVGTDINGLNKTALNAFSSIRVFYPTHRDYWNFGDVLSTPFPNKDQVPVNNMANLRLITDNAGVPLLAAGQTGKVVYPVASTTVAGKVDLVTEPLKAAGAYYNVYQNYINNNWIKLRGSFDGLRTSTLPITKKYSVALEVFPANFQQNAPYEFPNNWFLTEDWGATDAERKLNAKAYAMMFARAYSPKSTDCATCPSMVETIEIGNEPWGYTNATTYHAIVQGFIEGLADYYDKDTLNKIRLLPASFQAHHAETTTTANVSDINSWKDYINTRLPASSKCELEGINLHLYCNTIQGSSLTLNSNYPEKVAQSGAQTTALSHFFYIRNAWKWLKDNDFAKKNMFITEYGWDSDGCTADRAVGIKTQAIYTIRNTLMMGRYGVKKANLYQIEDDLNADCAFAYFTSGVFNTKRAPKYIFKALENFIQKTGNTKFHYALREDPNDVHAYILEQQDQPKYMVAWLARDINYVDDTKTLSQVIALGGTDLADGVGALKTINLSFNGKSYAPDATLPWYRLDGETTAPLSQTTYFVGGQYKLSPVPILIPIVESCNPDNQAPIFANCPANITQTTTTATATVTWTPPTASDNCTASPTLTSTHNAGATFPIGTTTVVYTAKDASNNAATCSFTVTVTNPCANDVVKPVFTNCPINIAQTITTGTTATVTWTPPTATDNCGIPLVTNTHSAGTIFPLGPTTVTYTATDARNNTATCSFIVTVTNPCLNDSIAPVFDNCPTDIIQTTATTSDTVKWTLPTVSDNCTTTPTMTSSHNSGTLFQIGVTTVTYTAKDAKNNTSTCIFKVTMSNPCLNDSIAPVFSTCPGDIAKTTTDTAAIATWTLPSAFDDCTESIFITGSHVSGTAFKLGSTKVTFTATDNKNNKSTCVFTVTVTNPCLTDTVKPVLSACPANISQLTTGTTATAIWTAPTATDNCSIPSVTSTHNSGATFPIGTTTVIYTAKDIKNNTATCSFTVTIALQPVNFCVSKGTEPWQEWVNGVQLNAINNMVQANEGKARDFNTVGYSDFTDMQTPLIIGKSYPLSIKSGFSWSGILNDLYCRAWIDFNGNKIFEDTEKIFEGKSLALFTANIVTPPNVVKGGATRMRVSIKSGSYPTACELFLRGEVEDYTINLQADTTGSCTADREVPVFTTCPANISLTTSALTAVATWTVPTATDNCTTPTLMSTHNPNASFPIGVTNVVYTATDGSNNSSTCSFTVTVINPCATDTIKPVLSACPTNISLTTADTSAIANWTPPTATDNCGTPSVTTTHNSGTAFKVGVTTVIYTATDAKTNKATCSFTVTVINPCATDTIKPVLSACPTNISLTTSDTSAIATWTPPTATDNCGTPSVTSTHNSGTAFKIGTTTVIYTATDAKTNKATCSFTVTVINPCATDTTKPVLSACPTNVSLTTADTSAIATWTPPTATDNCGTPSVTTTHNSGAAFKIGTTTVIYTATDAKTNKATCFFTVTVINPCATDTVKPVLSACPTNVSLTTADTIAIATWTPPTATDNCGTPSVTTTHNSGTVFKIGTTTVIYMATDLKNNKATCSFTVTVINPCATDTVKPVLSACPANITRVATGSTATATWTAPTATDNCSTASVIGSHSSGATFSIGVTTVTYNATDAKNNKATCAFTITVSPQNANYCASKAAEPYQEWISGVKLGTINNTPQANEGKSINWSVIGYSDFTNLVTNVNRGQSYPLSITPTMSWSGRLSDLYCRVWIDFNGDRTFDDTEKVLEGRAQNPFTSNVTIPIAAVSGNTRMRVSLKWGGLPTPCENYTSGEVEDYVVNIGGADCSTDTESPVFANCPTNISKTTADTAATATWTPPTATDICSTPSVISTHNSGALFKIGVTTVTYTATDAKNNTATCSFTVTVTNPCVNDIIAPTFANCPANIALTTTGTTATATWTAPTATDNCTTFPSVISSHNSGSLFPIGATTVTYTATDATTNKSMCSFSVTVTNPCINDTVAPVFVNCPASITQTAIGTTLTVAWTPPTVTDNCTANPTVTSTHTPNTVFPIGTTTVVYTARDASNNARTCSFTITVLAPNVNYCASKAAEPYQEWISGLRFGSINNINQANQGKSINWSVIGYSDFTTLATNVNVGQSYPLSIVPSLSWSGRLPDVYCRVWIDYNGNKIFEDTERVFEGRAQNPFTGNVVIPVTATTGNTRMRVSLKWGSLPTVCENYIPGEVEDYTISIR
jgi:hypothetical protein